MKNHLLASRYARALCESVPKDEDLEQAVQILSEFLAAYNDDRDLQNALNNPAIVLAKRAAVLDVLVKRFEMPVLLGRLLHTLLVRGRFGILDDVVGCLEACVDKRMGRAGAVVTTAVPLPDNAQQRLEESLAKFSGRMVRLECKVDPAIVGGIVVRLDGKLLDGSLRTRLGRLTEMLLNSDSLHEEN